MAKELKEERERSNLDVEELTHIWDGGEFITEKRREMGKVPIYSYYIMAHNYVYIPTAEAIVFNDPVFTNEDQYYLSNEEAFVRGMEKSVRYVEKSRELDLPEHPLKRPFFKRSKIL